MDYIDEIKSGRMTIFEAIDNQNNTNRLKNKHLIKNRGWK